MPMKRKSERRRVTLWPYRVSTAVDAATGARIEAAADRYGVTPAAIARAAIGRGLRLELDALRRSAQRTARQADTARTGAH